MFNFCDQTSRATSEDASKMDFHQNKQINCPYLETGDTNLAAGTETHESPSSDSDHGSGTSGSKPTNGTLISVADLSKIETGDHIEEGDDDNAASDIASNASSTIRYEQEPYDIFKDKVVKLCHDIGFGEPTEVERMKGGAFHRVIGLKFDSREVQDYILRVPREVYDESSRYETFNQVAILQYASQLDSIPTATVFAYDTTTNNALGSQYVLQERLPGKPMCDIFENATLGEKLQVIILVAELVAKLDAATLPHPGQIIGKGLPDASSTPLVPLKEPNIVGYQVCPGQDLPLPENQQLIPVLTDFLKARNEVDGEWMTPRYEKLQTMALQMQKGGLIRKADNENVVWLWDLAPQNILLRRTDGSTENIKPFANKTVDGSTPPVQADFKDPKWEITGVIDWDEVLSVPRIFARKPPSWLWVHPDTRPDTWMGDLDDNPGRDLTDDELLFKAYFDREMERLVPSYIVDAYFRGVWLRKVAQYAIKGFETSEDYDRLDDEITKDWNEYYRSLGFVVEDEENESVESANKGSDVDTNGYSNDDE